MNTKVKELATHDKDTGSSEIQIALLTEKIETLSIAWVQTLPESIEVAESDSAGLAVRFWRF